MKKLLLGLLIVLFFLLTLLYLAVNSPYVIDKIAKKFAPQYGFRYDVITGNPLKGIVVGDLYYKEKKLAHNIRIRINPYTLLEKQLTVSRLEVMEVNVTVLEEVIRNFTTSTGNEDTEESTGGGGLPLSIQVENIRLSLLPFRRYGVEVKKEELSVDSIHYSNDSFSVGKLRQVAETSLGRVELEGTYHRRFLDVKYLIVDDLDLPRLERLIATFSSPEGVAGEHNDSKETEEDIFLPRRIRAGKIWASLLPYEPTEGVKLEWTQVEGHDLELDLEHSRVVGGKLTADLQSNLAEARLKLHVDQGRFIIDSGVIGDLDLRAVMVLGGGESNGTEHSSAEADVSREPYDTIPYVPRYVDVRRLRIELKPGELQRIPYRAAVAKVKGLQLDLHDEKVLAKGLEAYLDTPLLHADLEASIGSKSLRVQRLKITRVDPGRIMKWKEGFSEVEQNGTQSDVDTAKTPEVKGAENSSGISIPFLPSVVIIDKALVETGPFKFEPLEAQSSRVLFEKLRIDLNKTLAESGNLKLDLSSNLADLRLDGTIRNNRLLLDPKRNRILLPESLFKSYGLPLRPEAFSPITVAGFVDKERAEIETSFHADKILRENNESKSSFNLDINRSVIRFAMDFSKGEFSVVNDSLVTTPQAPLTLHAELKSDINGELSYQGTLKAPGVDLGDAKIEKMLGHPQIDFKGDPHSVLAQLDAGVFRGTFRSDDLKKGLLTLQSKGEIEAGRYVKLPRELQKTALTLKVRTSIDFESPLPLDTKISVRSNVADLQGDLIYDGKVSAELVTTFPKNSLLKTMLPKLNLAALNPLKLQVKQKAAVWVLSLESRKIKARVTYDLTEEKITGLFNIAGSKVKVSGSPKKTILATLKTESVKQLVKNLTDIYRIEVPKLDGDLNLTLRIEELSRMSLELKSKQFVPDDTARIKSPIKNIELVLGADTKTGTLIVEKYSLETAGMKLFAAKPSRIKKSKELIVLESLWINDSLKATGRYDLKKKRGEIIAKAGRFKVVHENANLEASIDLKAKIIGKKIDAKGKVIILGGNVMYDIQAKHYATDEDIVIVQHRKKNEESFFRKNVQITLYIEAKKPLLFKQKNVYVELNPQLSIIKPYNSDLQLLGSVKLAKDGYYLFEGKKFVLQESSINFTGKPTQPLLDINLVYRRYSKTIYIGVNGVATEPNLTFSSDPYMTRSQILSFILFDTEDSGANAGDMLTMVGGGIAKSILGNIGLKVDTLIVTSEGFEVGKKITDNITILYDQKEEPKAIVRIKHSRRTETDISIGSESQSVDIIYKREF